MSTPTSSTASPSERVSVTSRAQQPGGTLGTQIVRFSLVGAITVCLDYGVLFLLASRLGISYLISAGLSFTIASLSNYFLSVRFVFVDGRFGRMAELFFFLATTIIGLLLNQAIMWSLVELLSLNYLIAKSGALAVVTAWNFISKKKIVFVD